MGVREERRAGGEGATKDWRVRAKLRASGQADTESAPQRSVRVLQVLEEVRGGVTIAVSESAMTPKHSCESLKRAEIEVVRVKQVCLCPS